MHRYILTGAPGAGKTALLRVLEQKGHAVVEEAATDVIALAQAEGRNEPWTDASFLDEIVALQKRREIAAAAWPATLQFFDRSPICTWALADFLGYAPSPLLRAEVARIERERVYERRVFFVENLSFVTPTAARRISFEDSLRFERVHADAYRQFGYEPVPIGPGDLHARADAVLRELHAPPAG